MKDQQWVSVGRVKKSQGEVMGWVGWETKHNPVLTFCNCSETTGVQDTCLTMHQLQMAAGS